MNSAQLAAEHGQELLALVDRHIGHRFRIGMIGGHVLLELEAPGAHVPRLGRHVLVLQSLALRFLLGHVYCPIEKRCLDPEIARPLVLQAHKLPENAAQRDEVGVETQAIWLRFTWAEQLLLVVLNVAEHELQVLVLKPSLLANDIGYAGVKVERQFRKRWPVQIAAVPGVVGVLPFAGNAAAADALWTAHFRKRLPEPFSELVLMPRQAYGAAVTGHCGFFLPGIQRFGRKVKKLFLVGSHKFVLLQCDRTDNDKNTTC